MILDLTDAQITLQGQNKFFLLFYYIKYTGILYRKIFGGKQIMYVCAYIISIRFMKKIYDDEREMYM